LADSQFIEPNPLLAPSPGDVGAIAPPVEVPIDILPLPEEPLVATLAEDQFRHIPGPGFLAALGWTVVLLVFQFVAVIFLAIPLVVLGVPPDQMEIYFRGFIGRGLLARYGMIAGTLLSSLLFGLVHIDPPQAIGVMVMGVTLQGVFVATRSLFAPMLLHGLNNSLSFTILKYDEPLAGTQHSPVSVVVSATVALVVLGVIFYQVRTHWISADGSVWSPGYVTGESPPASIAAECRVGRPTFGWLAVAALAYAALVSAVGWAMTNG
jgi:membrane protease YdiL (CAAX protease family)